MSRERAPRGFLLLTLGLVLPFAALGHAIGAAHFVPLAVLLAPPAAAPAEVWAKWIAAPFGHTVALFVAYVVGVASAAATGFVYAVWDVVAPERAPRALVSSLIGAAITYGLLLRLASVGACLRVTLDVSTSLSTADWTDATVGGPLDAALGRAFLACGGVAGLICALAASLLGLTTHRAAASSAPAPPGGEARHD